MKSDAQMVLMALDVRNIVNVKMEETAAMLMDIVPVPRVGQVLYVHSNVIKDFMEKLVLLLVIVQTHLVIMKLENVNVKMATSEKDVSILAPTIHMVQTVHMNACVCMAHAQ